MVTVNNLEEIKNVIPHLWNTYQQNISYICPDNYSAYYEGEFLEDPSGFNLHCDSGGNRIINIQIQPCLLVTAEIQSSHPCLLVYVSIENNIKPPSLSIS